MGKILEINRLKVHFDTLDGPVEALHSVNLSIDEGEIMGLVGESGCGKSVTSLVSIGLATCEVDDGSIKYSGKELIYRDKKENIAIQNKLSIVTSISIIGIIIGLFWTLLDPIGGLFFTGVFLILFICSFLVIRYLTRPKRLHEAFMRSIRGNQISMIFQEPMTALNPLYTIEKQVSEVMKIHNRLNEPKISRLKKVVYSILRPVSLVFYSLRNRPTVMVPVILSFFAVYIAHFNNLAGDYAEVSMLLCFFLLMLYPIFQSQNEANKIKIDQFLSQIPIALSCSIVIFLSMWMPLAALSSIIAISFILALPGVILSGYYQLDPEHEKQVVEILSDVKIPNPNSVAKMYPHELSGGMRQRVMIAMMMACEPKLLIADEPTTALDVTIQAQILQLMRDLRARKGTSIMLITHDLGVIAEMCDSVSVMYAGSVVETGSLDDVLTSPRMPYTIGLLHSIPKVRSRGDIRTNLPIIQGQVPNPNEAFDGCRFHPRCPFSTEICLTTPPPMVEINKGHFAACHHTDETKNLEKSQLKFDKVAI